METEIPILQQLSGKNVITVWGFTGAGKSTFCRAMLCGQDSLEFDWDICQLKVKGGSVKGSVTNQEVFKIADGMQACTKIPGFTRLDSTDIYLCDCPGINDNNPNDEFPNVSEIQTVLNNAKNFKFLMLFQTEAFAIERGIKLIESLCRISDHLDEKGVENARKFLIPVICRGNLTRKNNLT